MREITGAFQLNSQVAKWDPDQSLQCEWCGHAEDSRVHRLFECDAFSHIRDKHAAVLDALEPYREDFALLPVVSVHPHHEFHDMLLHSIPPALLPNEARQRVLDFHPDRPITCYTDGSCAHQSCTLTRCAAFRIVLDLATNDAERRHHARNFLGNREAPPVLQRLVCGRLQGVQSIHRAELAAIIWITQTFPSHGLVAYTDGAWVIDVWTKCLLPNSVGLFIDHSDRDLIQLTKVGKVRAHQNPLLEDDALARFHLLGNGEADHLAQWACWHLMPELVQQFVQLHDDRQLDILRVRDFYKYCLELQSTRAALQDLATWSVPQSPWTVPQVDETRLHKAVWGRHAMMSLLAWLRACAWPPDEENPSQHAKLGISWTEIAIAVPIRHGMWMPVKRIQQDNQEHILQPRTLSECHLLKITLAEQSAKISWMVKNLSSMLMQDVLPPISQGKVPALLVYGFRASTGLKVRSQFPEQSQVVSILRAYFP